MASNLCNQLRIVLAKAAMTHPHNATASGGDTYAPIAVSDKDTNRDLASSSSSITKEFRDKEEVPLKGPVLFRLVTAISAAQLLPVALFADAGSISGSVASLVDRGHMHSFMLHLLFSGLLLYAYNELSFRVLDLVRARAAAAAAALSLPQSHRASLLTPLPAPFYFLTLHLHLHLHLHVREYRYHPPRMQCAMR